ncbi:hypothetical protein V6N12_007489 [Hibiscus sabdariffa]|uniref:Uncharacterized protein n=1 Tax=Hibiscus sabdariffa TaxID=183260 RepID=A0ABR2F1X5_9ROSI
MPVNVTARPEGDNVYIQFIGIPDVSCSSGDPTTSHLNDLDHNSSREVKTESGLGVVDSGREEASHVAVDVSYGNNVVDPIPEEDSHVVRGNEGLSSIPQLRFSNTSEITFSFSVPITIQLALERMTILKLKFYVQVYRNLRTHY